MVSPSPERGRTRSRGLPSAFAKDAEESPRRPTPLSRTPSSGIEHERPRSASRMAKSPSPSATSSKIIVEKLTRNVQEGHLREIFEAYGKIKQLDMPLNQPYNVNRGRAYIVYQMAQSAESAIAHMHEGQLDGAIISVSIVLPRRKFSQSPPPARKALPPYARPPPPARGPPPPYDDRRPEPGRYRPPPRGYRRSPSPPRGYYGARFSDRGGDRRGGGRGRSQRDFDTYRPRSFSRSLTPRSRSLSSRSRSPAPRSARYGGVVPRAPPYRRRDSPPRRDSRALGRRSPSYSSYSSYSDRSRSRSRGYRR